jgi:hypothetical protein
MRDFSAMWAWRRIVMLPALELEGSGNSANDETSSFTIVEVD